MTEEERAALYREQCAARAIARAAQFTELAGDPAAVTATQAAWAPLRQQPSDAWDCPCEPELPRPAWADRIPGDVELPAYMRRAR